MKVTVVEGNLLDQEVDVIVNAWNRNIIPWWLLLPQGVSGAIKKRGGTGPFKEVRQHGRHTDLVWRLSPVRQHRTPCSHHSAGPSEADSVSKPENTPSAKRRQARKPSQAIAPSRVAWRTVW